MNYPDLLRTLNAQQIEVYPAGAELDALLAAILKQDADAPLPYSTEIAPAWKVVEATTSRLGVYVDIHVFRGDVHATISTNPFPPKRKVKEYFAADATMPLAMARAFLLYAHAKATGLERR